jgi:hypothetical protein
MGSTYPICMNRVSPDILWCQESYALMSNVFYAQNDYFWSFLGIVSKMMARVQVLCAEYVVKYGHSSIKLWHSRTRCIKRISERYHLSRLSHFRWSYGDLTVVSVGVPESLFDIAPLKWVKTWRTTHATNIRLKYTLTDGTPDNLVYWSFLAELWLFNDGFFETNSFFGITSSVYMIAQQVLL